MKKIRNSPPKAGAPLAQKFKIQNLRVKVGDKEIVKGINLEIKPGEIHALMGPNGSGKSTLAQALAGHPGCGVSGKILLGRRDLTPRPPEERAQAGLFLAFQYPVGVEGVTLFNFLKAAQENLVKGRSPSALLAELKTLLPRIGLDESFLKREVNFGLSGGEKKRAEVLQALVLRPRIAIFDETDSGLDVDALRDVAENIQKLAQEGTGVLVITHYQRILRYLSPNFVHVLVGGGLVESGGAELAVRLEKEGYRRYR